MVLMRHMIRQSYVNLVRLKEDEKQSDSLKHQSTNQHYTRSTIKHPGKNNYPHSTEVFQQREGRRYYTIVKVRSI